MQSLPPAAAREPAISLRLPVLLISKQHTKRPLLLLSSPRPLYLSVNSRMIRPTAVRSLARSAPAYSGAFRPSARVSARKPEFQPHFGGITPGVVMRLVEGL